MSVIGIVLVGAGVAAAADMAGPMVYIGTYTGGGSKGIYLSRLDQATGSLSQPVCVAETPSPSFLSVHTDGKHLYAVNETSQFHGEKTGSVTAFAIDSKTGGLSQLNQQPSAGMSPCHLVVDRSGRFVLVANYSSGTVAVLPIGKEGQLEKPAWVIQHEGSSVNKRRQEGPHAHGVYLDNANRFVFVPDLGLDRVQVYGFEPSTGSLLSTVPAGGGAGIGRGEATRVGPYQSVELKPGAGPRHMAFDPRERFAFVINELNSTLTVFEFNPTRATLTERQTVSTLPVDFTGASSTAEVVMHPSGRFIYGSNRGHDSLAVFKVNEKSGELALIEHESTQGKTPRHFAIDPSGRWLLAANQDSNTIVSFHIDAQSGKLEPAGSRIEVGKPVCLVFYKPMP